MTRENKSRRSFKMIGRAREFRHGMTPSEEVPWKWLRNRGLGAKFRRQHLIGRFIVGFCCAEARLAIEIDGDTHAAPDQATYDSARTAWLEERGCRVIRFHAEEVERNLEKVLEAIRGAYGARAAAFPEIRKG